jgi:hypothetical protein
MNLKKDQTSKTNNLENSNDKENYKSTKLLEFL